jgi:biopolymer transport protein ExbB/TolQ
MLFWVLSGVAVWILGMIVYYILDGWFDYGFKEEDTGFFIFTAVIWPIWIWFVIPGILAGKAHDALKAVRLKREEQKEKEKKIRIAQEKEIEKIEADLTHEFNQIEHREQEKSGAV